MSKVIVNPITGQKHVVLDGEVPIPKNWVRKEKDKIVQPFDLAPHFRDWITCDACGGKGHLEIPEPRNGYSIIHRVDCEKCHGAGGRHAGKEKT